MAQHQRSLLAARPAVGKPDQCTPDQSAELDYQADDSHHIYLNMRDTGAIVCPYCSTLFRFDPSLGEHEADPAACAYGDID